MNAPFQNTPDARLVEFDSMLAPDVLPDAGRRNAFALLRDLTRLKRTAFAGLSIRRILRGGRINDAGRLPRYALTIAMVLGAIWVPIILYLGLASPSYTSTVSLILPGAGIQSSVSLSEIGQASTSAPSPYSSSSISPTVTYQKLVQSRRVIGQAAKQSGVEESAFGKPRVKLVDQTSLMEIEMRGATPEEAKARAEAMLAAFLSELNTLRDDEIARRETSATGTVTKYQDAVNAIRDKISSLQIATGLSSTDQYAEIVQGNEDLMAGITEGKAELEQSNSSVASLSKLLGTTPEAASMTIKLQADPDFSAQSKALAEATTKLAELAGLYGPRHPEVLDAKKRHLGIRLRMLERAMAVTGLGADEVQAGLERSVEGERGALLSTLVSEVAKRDGLTARLSILEEKLEANLSRLVQLTEAASQLDRLNRDYKVAEAVFTSALARLNVSKTDIFASYPMVQIAEPASLPWKPSSPKPLLAIAAGLMATVCTLIGLALTWLRRPLVDRLTGYHRRQIEAPDAAA